MSSTTQQPPSNNSRATRVPSSSRNSQLRVYRLRNSHRFHPYPSREPSLDTIKEEVANEATTPITRINLLHRLRAWVAGGIYLNIGIGHLQDVPGALFIFGAGLCAYVGRALGLWR